MAGKLKKFLKTLAVGRDPAGTFRRLAITAAFAAVIFRFFLVPARLRGESMEPAYRDGSINFINTLAYRRTGPRRGDVVGILLAGRRVMLFKRIIGLPGENLAFRGGRLFIDGEPYDEPYLESESDWDFPEVEIGPDEYFVAGDNREIPVEGHQLGRVRRERISGKAVF